MSLTSHSISTHSFCSFDIPSRWQAKPGVVLSRDRSFPILVVEDTEDLREGLATVLRLEGYHVVTADNGLLALDAVYDAEYCLILLDIAMPIMDGL